MKNVTLDDGTTLTTGTPVVFIHPKISRTPMDGYLEWEPWEQRMVFMPSRRHVSALERRGFEPASGFRLDGATITVRA